MKKLLFGIISKFMTADVICSFIGYLLGKLISWASKLDKWDLLKKIIKVIRGWIDIVDEVIEDDNLTKDEENKIAEALKNTMIINKVSDIIREK